MQTLYHFAKLNHCSGTAGDITHPGLVADAGSMMHCLMSQISMSSALCLDGLEWHARSCVRAYRSPVNITLSTNLS